VLTGAWLLYALRKILLLLAFTVFFCYLSAPLIELVERPRQVGRWRWRAPHLLAIVIAYAVLLGAIILILDLILPSLSEQISLLAAKAPDYVPRLDQYVSQLSSWPARYHLPPSWKQAITDGLNASLAGGLDWLRLGIVKIVGLTFYLPWLVLIPILGFFLLKDGQALNRQFLASLPEGDLRRRAANFLRDMSRTLAAYIRAQLLACLIVGTIVTVGLWLLGAPYSLVLGVVAGLLEFIPLFGPLVVAVVASLMASFESWRLALLVLIFLASLRLVEDYFIYPRLISREIELHPLVVILAVLCGAELGGVVGIFLSVPVAALLVLSWRHWRESNQFGS